MDWTTLLFSFNGRINRAKYWLAVLIYVVVWTAFIAGCFASDNPDCDVACDRLPRVPRSVAHALATARFRGPPVRGTLQGARARAAPRPILQALPWRQRVKGLHDK